MDDKTFYAKILGIYLPWFLKQIVVNDEEQRVDIYVEHERGKKYKYRITRIIWKSNILLACTVQWKNGGLYGNQNCKY
jgi:hypothetical protein